MGPDLKQVVSPDDPAPVAVGPETAVLEAGGLVYAESSAALPLLVP